MALALTAASDVVPWQDDGKGRVRLNCGGKLEADATQDSKGVYVVYIPNGEKFTVGHKDSGGTYHAATAQYTAVATAGKKCFCKVRMRLRPNVTTLSSGVDLAPVAIPAKSESYLTGSLWLADKAVATPAIRIGSDVLELSDEATAVAVGGGKKTLMEFQVKLLASKEPPADPYIPPE